MLEQLTVLAQVFFGEADGAERFGDKEPVVFRIEMDLVDGTSRNDQVIAIAKGKLAVERAQYAAAFVDEDHLIGIGILVEVAGYAVLRRGQYDMHVVIDQHGNAAVEVVFLRRNFKAVEAAVLEHFFLGDLWRYRYRFFGFNDLRGRVDVVEQGRIVGEAFGGKKLLGIKAAIGLAELGMALMGYLTQLVIIRHSKS